jgi:hypothetical protein
VGSWMALIMISGVSRTQFDFCRRKLVVESLPVANFVTQRTGSLIPCCVVVHSEKRRACGRVSLDLPYIFQLLSHVRGTRALQIRAENLDSESGSTTLMSTSSGNLLRCLTSIQGVRFSPCIA